MNIEDSLEKIKEDAIKLTYSLHEMRKKSRWHRWNEGGRR